MPVIYKPRVILQDAFVIDVNGELHSLMKTGMKSDFCFVPINRHELKNIEGLNLAVDFIRQHRLRDYAQYGAAACETAERFHGLHGYTPQQLAGSEQCYEVFAAADEEGKAAISQHLFDKKLKAMRNNPEMLESLNHQMRDKFRPHLGQAICAVMDVMKNASISALLEARESFGKTAMLKVIPAITALGLLKPYTGYALYAVLGAGAVPTLTPFGDWMRKKLLRHPPAMKNPEALVEMVQQSAEEYLSPRIKALTAGYMPIIMVSASKDYVEPDAQPAGIYLKHFLDVTAGMQYEWGDVWLQAGSIRYPVVLREEMEHVVNDMVGFDDDAWSKAFFKDMKHSTARHFINHHSKKGNYRWVYTASVVGAETLEELGVLYDEWTRQGKSREQVLATIEAAMPHCGALFREYIQREAGLFAACAQPPQIEAVASTEQPAGNVLPFVSRLAEEQREPDRPDTAFQGRR